METTRCGAALAGADGEPEGSGVAAAATGVLAGEFVCCCVACGVGDAEGGCGGLTGTR